MDWDIDGFEFGSRHEKDAIELVACAYNWEFNNREFNKRTHGHSFTAPQCEVNMSFSS